MVKNIHQLCTNYKMMYDNAAEVLVNYLTQNPNIKSLVIGISGGIDSAVTAAIAMDACFKTSPHINVIGRSLPMTTNTKQEIQRAANVGNAFTDYFAIRDLSRAVSLIAPEIDDGYLNMVSMKPETIEEKIRLGNIRARLRMIQLYHLAHLYNGMVLSTDNLTEYLLGFWTLHGDVGDFGLIQNAWKTEVYGIAEYIVDQCVGTNNHFQANAIRECITAVPTNGLGITNSDLEQLGAGSYAEVDDMLIKYLSGSPDVDLEHPVIQRHKRSHFKRENPINIRRVVLTGR